MATIVITRCAGTNHYTMTVTEAWGTHPISGEVKDLLAAAKMRSDSDLLEDVKKSIKQAGATTAVQIKTVVESTTYQDTDPSPAARDV